MSTRTVTGGQRTNEARSDTTNDIRNNVARPPAGDRQRGTPTAICILLFTLAMALVWSHLRLMWNDEFLSFYGDSVRTAAGVLRVQWHTPISLDPPAYHLLSHLAMDVFGRTATALRMPAMAGFLLLQWSLFLLVRRIAGYRPALLAMALPLCTASFRYAVEGRPYGLLLGLYAAALTCWFFAAQDRTPAASAARSQPRWAPLAGLFLSVAVAINSHYFGVLILLPVGTAEAVRILQRRRIDRPMLATLAASFATIAFILPGKAALAPYQRHYYVVHVSRHAITQGYRELFIRYTSWSIPVQHVIAAILVLATVLLVVATVRRFRHRSAQEPAALWAGLLACATLPFFGYLFGRYVTHTVEVRYVIATIIPFAVSIPLVFENRLRSTFFFRVALAAILVVAGLLGVSQIRADRDLSASIMDAMRLGAPLQQELQQHPAERLYTQQLNAFFLESFYATDPLLRERITWVYDEPSEIRWLNHNTNAVTAVNLQQFSHLPIVPYEQMLQVPGALLLNYGSGWEWIGDDLRSRHVPVENLGKEAGAKLERLNGPTESR